MTSMPITDALIALNSLSKKEALKTICKYARGIKNPYFVEAIIVQLEAILEGENPDFTSKTP
jgi:hypothetical protein